MDLVTERGKYTFPVSVHHEVVTAADPDDPLWRGVDFTGKELPDGAPVPSFTSYNVRTKQVFGTTRFDSGKTVRTGRPLAQGERMLVMFVAGRKFFMKGI